MITIKYGIARHDFKNLEEKEKMIFLKECPRCQGDLSEGSDAYGKFVSCLQCGYLKDVDVTENKPKLQKEGKPGKRVSYGGRPNGSGPI